MNATIMTRFNRETGKVEPIDPPRIDLLINCPYWRRWYTTHKRKLSEPGSGPASFQLIRLHAARSVPKNTDDSRSWGHLKVCALNNANSEKRRTRVSNGLVAFAELRFDLLRHGKGGPPARRRSGLKRAGRRCRCQSSAHSPVLYLSELSCSSAQTLRCPLHH
jgi:hypothetical protein